VIGLPLAAVLARVTESRLRTTMREPFVVTARARGLSGARCLLTVALPNAAVPLLVVAGQLVGAAVAGTLVAETVFGWPGLGDYLVRALQFRDWYPLQAAVLLVAAAAVAARGIAGSLAALVDARAGRR
jgi:ABC-type dipeptide/oligopeptide/nickel transport system permease component